MKRLFNVAEAAEYLGVIPFTLNAMRREGAGPAIVLIGRKVLYDQVDLDKYIETCRQVHGQPENDILQEA